MPSEACKRTCSLTPRRAFVALACLGSVAAAAQTQTQNQGYTQVLDTPSFTIRIEVKCPEAEVTCDDVSYRGENKRTRKFLSLRGSTAHRMCADKVTPCRFLGYIFKSGAFTYFVSEGGELLVQDGKKVLVQESGAWQ